MNKIFINIASYRDSELIHTVNNLITNAEYPELLRIVVYEQNGPNDSSIYGVYPTEQVLVLRDHYSIAKGPVWARAKIQKEYSKEEYYLQIDSHMRTIKNWDTVLKHLINLVPEPAVLTQYPPEYSLETNNLDPNKIRSGLYIQGFGPKDHFTRIQSDFINPVNKRNFPYTSKAWSACFSFSRGNIVKDAVYESTFEYLFFGEELDITLKLFTRGYYFFSPHISVFYTLFKRSHRATYWLDIPIDQRQYLEEKSINKLWKRILNYEKGPCAYDTVRTIKDYMKFADIISFENSKLSTKAKAFRRKTSRHLLR